MGRVYLAERADGEVERQVAIKVLADRRQGYQTDGICESPSNSALGFETFEIADQKGLEENSRSQRGRS